MCFLVLFSIQEVRPFSAIVRQMGLPEEKPVNIVLFSALHRFPAVFNAQPVYNSAQLIERIADGVAGRMCHRAGLTDGVA